MKKEVTRTVSECDACHRECDYATKCKSCGKEFCCDCRKLEGKFYHAGLYFSGSNDGYYCNECDANKTKGGHDKLHNAYRRLKSLRMEVEAWQTDFDERRKKAELDIKTLVDQQPAVPQPLIE